MFAFCFALTCLVAAQALGVIASYTKVGLHPAVIRVQKTVYGVTVATTLAAVGFVGYSVVNHGFSGVAYADCASKGNTQR